MSSAEFPALYQAHQGRYTDDLPFWLRLAADSQTPVLELGCGTGRVTVPLAADGHTVLALDHDLAMLQFLRSRLNASLSRRVLLIQADMTAFAFHRPLALIILPCNTLSTLHDQALTALLNCVAQHLLAAGRFVASIPNPDVMRSLPTHGPPEVEDVFRHPRTAQPVQVSTVWHRDATHLHVTWHYDHLFPDGRLERTSITLRHRLDGWDFYRQAFARAGLRIQATYGDFDGSPWTSDAPYLILEAGPAP